MPPQTFPPSLSGCRRGPRLSSIGAWLSGTMPFVNDTETVLINSGNKTTTRFSLAHLHSIGVVHDPAIISIKDDGNTTLTLTGAHTAARRALLHPHIQWIIGQEYQAPEFVKLESLGTSIKETDVYASGPTLYKLNSKAVAPFDGRPNGPGMLNTFLYFARSCFKCSRKKTVKVIMDKKATVQEILAANYEALDSILDIHQCSRTPDGSSPREDAFHSILDFVLSELHAMAHSIAEHGRHVRMDDLQTMRELVQELSLMEPRLRESRAQQVLSARSLQHIREEKKDPDIDLFPSEPPAYGPIFLPSLHARAVRDDHSRSPSPRN
jgi:hypothetical protein